MAYCLTESISPKQIPYDTSMLTERQFIEHMKIYKGYVDKANETSMLLDDPAVRGGANKTYSEYRSLRRGQSFSLNGIIFHELYFQNMTNDPQTPCLAFEEITNKCFGGFNEWAADFIACAKSARGWCIAGFEQRTGRFMNFIMDSQDDGVVCAMYPIIVLDMYEHAYYTDYGVDTASYINNFMKAINWDIVEDRVKLINL